MLRKNMSIRKAGCVVASATGTPADGWLSKLKEYILRGLFLAHKTTEAKGSPVVLTPRDPAVFPFPSANMFAYYANVLVAANDQKWEISEGMVDTYETALLRDPSVVDSDPEIRFAANRAIQRMALTGNTSQHWFADWNRGRIYTSGSTPGIQRGALQASLLRPEQVYKVTREEGDFAWAFLRREYGLQGDRKEYMENITSSEWRCLFVLDPQGFGKSKCVTYSGKANSWSCLDGLLGLHEAERYGETSCLLGCDYSSFATIGWALNGDPEFRSILSSGQDPWTWVGACLHNLKVGQEVLPSGLFNEPSNYRANGKCFGTPLVYGCSWFVDSLLYGGKVGLSQEMRTSLEKGDVEWDPEARMYEVRRDKLLLPLQQAFKGWSDEAIIEWAKEQSSGIKAIFSKRLPWLTSAIEDLRPVDKPLQVEILEGVPLRFYRVDSMLPAEVNPLDRKAVEAAMVRYTLQFTPEEYRVVKELGFDQRIQISSSPVVDATSPLAAISGAIQGGTDVATMVLNSLEGIKRGWPGGCYNHDSWYLPMGRLRDGNEIMRNNLINLGVSGAVNQLSQLADQVGIKGSYKAPTWQAEEIACWKLTNVDKVL